MAQRTSLQPALDRIRKKLERLPPGAVILDSAGQAWQQGRSYAVAGLDDPYWYRAYGDSSFISAWELCQIAGPKITVIHPSEAAS